MKDIEKLRIQEEKLRIQGRHIQRFLNLSVLSIPLIWFPIIEAVIQRKIKLGQRLYLAIDRTQ